MKKKQIIEDQRKTIELLEEENYKYKCSSHYIVQQATFIGGDMKTAKILYNGTLFFMVKRHANSEQNIQLDEEPKKVKNLCDEIRRLERLLESHKIALKKSIDKELDLDKEIRGLKNCIVNMELRETETKSVES